MPNPTIDFYLLNTSNPDTMYRFLCRLIDKAYQQQHKIVVQASSFIEGQRIDELLWTFRDISFIPHQLITDQQLADPMISISIVVQKPNQANADILFNLCNSIPSNLYEFTRIIEIVSDTKETKNQSRKKYRSYKEQNCQLTMHPINESC